MIAEGSEWRTFSDSSSKGDPNRVGGPENELMEDMGLSTIIGGDDSGSGGEADILAKLQNRGALKNSQRSLLAGFNKTKRLGGTLSLPQSITDRACEIFKRVEDSKELKGRKTDDVVAACIFIACRQAGVPRTLKELCAIADVQKRDVGRCFAKIKKLKIYKKPSSVSSSSSSKRKDKQETQSMQAPDIAPFMERYISQLSLPPGINKAAVYFSEKLRAFAIAEGKTPQSIAGGALFMLCQLHPREKRSLKQIATVCVMAESTIRTAYKSLYPHRSKLISPDYATQEEIQALSTS